MSDQEHMSTVMDSVLAAHEIVREDPSRPQYHLLPPAMWMNDPNGPIYYNNKYHLFYQTNPFKPKWGVMYWGHVESPNLLEWTHLPFALAPDKEHGEKYCFSGCCINNNGIPTILYSSIKSLAIGVLFGAETWSATSDSDLILWRRNPSNPIIDRLVHKNERVRHVRDPYVWEENNQWHMVLGGQLIRPKRGALFHFISSDLEKWNYTGVFFEGDPKIHKKPWECPNYLKLAEKSLIIISPFDKVQYAFTANKNTHLNWHILDHGNAFYAPNTLKNPENPNTYLLWGWIKGGGITKQWNGCFSIPRIISLEDGEFRISPSPVLNKLRRSPQHFEHQSAIVNLRNGSGEVFLKFPRNKNCVIQLYNKLEDAFIIRYDAQTREIYMGNEIAPYTGNTETILLHLFIDHSVLEMFIDYKECFTSRYYPRQYHNLTLDCKVPGLELLSMDVWEMKPLIQQYPLE